MIQAIVPSMPSTTIEYWNTDLQIDNLDENLTIKSIDVY